MAKINWTEESEFWLRDIHDYIFQDNPKAAGEVVAGIFQRAQVLRDHPEIGYRYESPHREEIRILLYGHYRIAYVVLENRVDILGIFHGALDIDRYL